MKNYVAYNSQLHKTTSLPLVSYELKKRVSCPQESIMGMFNNRALRSKSGPKIVHVKEV
jgi:hypothetical protein